MPSPSYNGFGKASRDKTRHDVSRRIETWHQKARLATEPFCIVKLNRIQRAVIVVYCLALAYCCLWIPWCLPWNNTGDDSGLAGSWHVGYGWLWSGPRQLSWPRSLHTSPDLPLIALRLAATTALAGAALALTSLKSSSTHN
jgi:hypothetical protein